MVRGTNLSDPPGGGEVEAVWQELAVATSRRSEWVDITDEVARAVAGWPAGVGAVLVYCPHTTAGVAVNEGWDPDVAGDVLRALEALVPQVPFRHAEGNSPAHLLAALTGVSAVVPVEAGRLRLGRWQRIFLCEYDGPRRRSVWLRGLAGA